MVQLIIGYTTTNAVKIWVKSADGAAFSNIILKDGGGASFTKQLVLNKSAYDTGVATMLFPQLLITKLLLPCSPFD